MIVLLLQEVEEEVEEKMEELKCHVILEMPNMDSEVQRDIQRRTPLKVLETLVEKRVVAVEGVVEVDQEVDQEAQEVEVEDQAEEVRAEVDRENLRGRRFPFPSIKLSSLVVQHPSHFIFGSVLLV